MKRIRTHLFFIFLALFMPFTLSSCGLFAKHQVQRINTEQVERDTSCSYFYFLWGTHEEYNQHYREALDAYQKSLICDPLGDYVRDKIPILYLKMDQPEKAINLLTKELNKHPDDIARLMLLARIFMQQKNSEKAIEYYLKIIGYEPSNEQALLRLGALLNQTGDLESARKYFSRLLQINPESYFSRLYLARIAEQLGKVTEAEEHYMSALDLNWSEDLIYEITDFYLKNRQYEENLVFLRSVSKKGNNTERIKLTIVQTLLALDKEEEAIAELSLVKNKSPEQISLDLSRLYLRNGDKKKAIENLKAVIETQKVPEARNFLAIIYLDSGEYDNALAVLKNINPEQQQFVDEVFLKSRALHEASRTDEAIKMMKGYLNDTKTRRPLFYVVASSLLRDSSRPHEATKVLARGIHYFPDDERLLFEYGLQLERMERLEEAIVIMEKIIAANPDHAEALNFVGYSWADTDRNFEKALEYIVKAMKLKPNNGYIQDSLGWIYFKLGNFERAQIELIGALKLVPEDPYVHEHLGDVYHALNMIEKALTEYETALKFYEDEKKKKSVSAKIKNIQKP